MFELLPVVIFLWLLVKALGLAFRMTWGLAKIAAAVLIAVAMPVLLICFLFVGGIALLLPLALIGMAFGILRACV